jgi:hypothetical protein
MAEVAYCGRRQSDQSQPRESLDNAKLLLTYTREAHVRSLKPERVI